jgi:hypothetical protein
MCLPQTLLMPAKREFYILQSCCCSNCYFDPVPDGCLDGPDPAWKATSARPARQRGRVTFDFHTGDVEVCCFQEDFACLAAPADAPRVCGVLGYTLYPAKGCCITLKQLYPERPEIVLKQNNTVLCAGCVGVGEKTLWSQAIYCRPPATFLFVELRCCCLAHDFGLNIAGDGDGCILPNCSEYVPMACAFLGFMCMPKKGCCVKVSDAFEGKILTHADIAKMMNNDTTPPASPEKPDAAPASPEMARGAEAIMQ